MPAALHAPVYLAKRLDDATDGLRQRSRTAAVGSSAEQVSSPVVIVSVWAGGIVPLQAAVSGKMRPCERCRIDHFVERLAGRFGKFTLLFIASYTVSKSHNPLRKP